MAVLGTATELERRRPQIVFTDFVGPVVAGLQLRNPILIDVEASDLKVPGERNRDWKAYIPEADHGNPGLPLVHRRVLAGLSRGQ